MGNNSENNIEVSEDNGLMETVGVVGFSNVGVMLYGICNF